MSSAERLKSAAPALRLEQTLQAAAGLVELIPVATCICDLDGRILHYNRRAVEIWGRAPKPGETHEQFTGASRFYGGDGQPLAQSKVNEVLQTGRAVRDTEVIVDRGERGRVAVLLNIDPLLDAQGRMVGIIHCIQDITERKIATEALDRSRHDLRQQEERWKATYEHAAIGIVEIDAEGRFLRVNEAICGIMGLDREELLGQRLFARTYPADRDTDEELYRRQVRGELGFYSIEKRLVRKDGRAIWCAIRSSTVRDAAGNFLYGVRVVQDITERKEAEDRQKLLIDELNHRVKNTLATVQSLATQTARGAASPEGFRKAFEGRLIALSQAHDQLTRRHWSSADLRDIAVATVTPYLTRPQGQLSAGGCEVTVSPRAALTLALTFHELTTNATKYGALSRPEGSLELRWRVDRSAEPARLLIEWTERGGPPVKRPQRKGFGSRFIEGSIASELRGVARLDYAPDGLRCTIDVPLDAAGPRL